MADDLNPRQRKFAEIYDGNATEAAIRAGYASGSAEVTGARLLRNAKVQGIIKGREQSESRVRIASRQQRQEFWTSVMSDGEVDMKDRLKASELLGKSEGDFLDRVELSGQLNLAAELRKARERVGRK